MFASLLRQKVIRDLAMITSNSTQLRLWSTVNSRSDLVSGSREPFLQCSSLALNGQAIILSRYFQVLGDS